MTNDLKNFFKKDNLLRAWRWIVSNPEYKYKNYFRDSYSSYNLSLDYNINDLRDRLKNDQYEPSCPCQVFAPKNTCTMRPFTLLSIEDQIVYQGFINIIAEYHYNKVSGRYNKTVFGNLYAGKRSIFFNRKWIDTYNEYRRSIKKCYKMGTPYIASFDLTACYDSIDHQVIDYFLNEYGIQKEFRDRLNNCLSRWSTNGEILHGHGIPQGPVASGLLSEVVLSHFDAKYEKLHKKYKNVFYFRYVDDIKLLGKDERTLRIMLANLDYASKQIGLFPQSQKISIHKIEDIDKETKSVSMPLLLTNTSDCTKEINSKIVSLIKKYKIQKPTEFKMYLAKANPNSSLSIRMLNLLNYHPEMSENIAFYFQRYPRKISTKVVNKLIDECKKPDVFQIVNSQQILAFKDKLSPPNNANIVSFLQKKWEEKKQSPLNPMYRVACLSYLLEHNMLSYKEINNLIRTESDWWALKSIIKYINIETIGEPSYLELMNNLIRNHSNDVALAAAQEIINKGLKLKPPYLNINLLAQNTLKYSGIIYRRSNSPSYIGDRLNKICKWNFPKYKWKKYFGTDHDAAENKIIRVYGYSQSDMSAFVNILDVFNDLLLDKLFKFDGSIGSYGLGNMGGALNIGCRFQKKYPCLFYLCDEIHQKRLECDLSHAIIKKSKTKKYTRYIEYKYVYRARKLMIAGYCELIDTLKI